MADTARSHALQIIGSLLVAVAIVAVTVSLVTSRLGPGLDDDRGRDARDRRQERQEDLRERREERREERRKD